MNNTILTVLSLSVSGSVLTLVLLALRPLLKNKVSKTFQYYIWLLVLLRLALPLSFDGSIINRFISQTDITQLSAIAVPDNDNGETQGDSIPQGNEQIISPEIAAPGTALNSNAEPSPRLSAVPEPTRLWTFALDHLTTIWLLGAALYFGWFIIAYLRFSRKLRKTSTRPHPKDLEVFAQLRGSARVQIACNPYINTPMLIGFLSPCIMIPHQAFTENGMKPELQHILRHEMTHYRRRDLLYKWFAVFVSAFHWFNPLMILVRREVSRTCELSCDEAVLRSLDAAERQAYGETLLTIASSKRLPAGVVTTTMCEGKRELKERLENIMAYKRKGVFVVAVSLVLALLLAGCGMALGAANITQMPDETSQSPAVSGTPSVSTSPDAEASTPPAITDTPVVSTTPSSDNSPALAAYNAVLQNKAEFFSTDNKKKLYLNDFLTNKEIYETVFDVTHFTVLDMDGDNVPEVVLELSVGGNPQFYEVLHYMNGTVYGYLIVYRGLTELKADGTFLFSGGAADSGVGKLEFDSTAYTTDKLGYSQSSQDGTNMAITYFINNQSAAKEAFDSFMNEQSGKKGADWYEFSQTNIDTELS